jgi:hypothetical protein
MGPGSRFACPGRRVSVRHTPAFSRHECVRVLEATHPRKQRGRRECRVMASPMARLQQKKQAAVTTGGAGQPAFPARWFTAYIAISPGTGLSCPRRLRDVNTIANLASASGGQDHATSPSAPATFVRRVLRVHRIPAPHIVTIGRNVPLHRGGMRERMVVICPTEQARMRAADWRDGQFVHGGVREVRVGQVGTRSAGR